MDHRGSPEGPRSPFGMRQRDLRAWLFHWISMLRRQEKLWIAEGEGTSHSTWNGLTAAEYPPPSAKLDDGRLGKFKGGQLAGWQNDGIPISEESKQVSIGGEANFRAGRPCEVVTPLTKSYPPGPFFLQIAFVWKLSLCSRGPTSERPSYHPALTKRSSELRRCLRAPGGVLQPPSGLVLAHGH